MDITPRQAEEILNACAKAVQASGRFARPEIARSAAINCLVDTLANIPVTFDRETFKRKFIEATLVAEALRQEVENVRESDFSEPRFAEIRRNQIHAQATSAGMSAMCVGLDIRLVGSDIRTV